MGNKFLGTKLAAALLAASAGLALAAPATAAEIKLGGYVKLDLAYSDRVTGTRDAAEVAPWIGRIPLKENQNNDHNVTTLDARESRFNITVTEKVGDASLKGFVEGDFFNDDKQFGLRHAYGEVTLPSGYSFLGGQTWSNFVDVDMYPETIDFNGPAGQLFARNAQARVGLKKGDATFTASLEENKIGQAQELPILTAKVMYAPKAFMVALAGAVTQNRAVNVAVAGDSDEETASALMACASVPVGKATLFGHVQYIDGLSRLANGEFADADLIAGEVRNVKTYGAMAGATFAATDTVTVNGLYGWAQAKDSDAARSTANGFNGDKTMQSFHVNVLKKIYTNMKVGLEFQRYERKQFAENTPGLGTKGEFNRIHAAYWYYF